MKNIIRNNKQYVKIIVSIVLSYILIKIIDDIPKITPLLNTIYTVISPFILAFVMAYILNPVVNLFNKRLRLNRCLSIALTYLSVIAVIALAITFLVPKLYNSLIDIIDTIPIITSYVEGFFNNINLQIQSHLNITDTLIKPNTNVIISTVSSFISNISNWLLSSAVSITSSIIKIIFGFLISIYVLADKEKFINFSKKITIITLGKVKATSFITFIKTLNSMIGRYIGIKTIDSLIIGCLAFIGLTLMQSEYSLLLSVIIGITNMIPYFGPFIGMTVGAFINLFISPIKAFMVFIYIFLLQQFDAWYLDPKLIGNKVGLRPFLVLFAVTLGGALYGPIGMILGSPVLAVIKIYIDRLINKYNYKNSSQDK